MSDTGLEAATERAAEILPKGCIVSVCVEKDAGYVEFHDSHGNQMSLDSADRSLAEQVAEATDWLIDWVSDEGFEDEA